MAVCGGITVGATYDCDDPIQPGVNPRIWLANKDDITNYTYGANNNLVTAITMVALKTFFVFQGSRQSVEPSVEFIPQPFTTAYDHIINFHVFDISSAQKVNLQALALGKVVAIVENANAAGNGDSVFEIYGAGAGLEVVSMTRLARDTETGGAFSIGLKTSDNEGKESKLPLSLWSTDYATTLALITALE